MGADKYMLRAARDTLMDQLTLARIFPIADLPIQAEERIVPHDNYTYITIEYSQPDVHYEVYDNQNGKIGEADGGGSTLKIQTGNLINEDYTFSVKAFKIVNSKQLVRKNSDYVTIEHSIPAIHYEIHNNENKIVGEADGNGGTLRIQTGAPVSEDYIFSIKAVYTKSKQLLQTVTVNVGVNTGLAVSLQKPVIDFNTAAVIIIGNAQSNTRYEVFDLKDTSLGKPVDNGPSGDIQLQTKLLKEDTAVKIKATNIKTGLGGILVTKPEIKVNPDTALSAALLSPAAYKGQAIIRLSNTQQSADYQLRLEDIDDDAADKAQLKNAATGMAVTGTGGTIELATDSLQEDITVNILATKKGSGISKGLSVNVSIPVKPDPARALSLVKDATESGRNTVVSSVARGESAVIKVTGTQKGVRYQLRSGNTNVGMPAYHHKNYGIGKARVNIELAIGAFSGDSVYLPTGLLTQTTTFSVLAIKATTRQEAVLAGTITVEVK